MYPQLRLKSILTQVDKGAPKSLSHDIGEDSPFVCLVYRHGIESCVDDLKNLNVRRGLLDVNLNKVRADDLNVHWEWMQMSNVVLLVPSE